MPGGWVYIMTSRPHGPVYVGVTSHLARRAHEHREGLVEGFTRRYGLKRLVFAEHHPDIRSAIQREKNIKHWPRMENRADRSGQPGLERSLRMPTLTKALAKEKTWP